MKRITGFTLLGTIFAVGVILVAIVGAAPEDPAGHTTNKDGALHAEDKDRPFSSHCTDCHAPDLQGGLGPSCYLCHGQKWNGSDVSNLAPPLDHTLAKIGVLHKPGFGTPLTSGCTLCHGPNLDDGFAPSCYSCHDRIWAGEGPPPDHTVVEGGFAKHKPGTGDPYADGCTQCHGPNLNDGFAPSCDNCHGQGLLATAHDFTDRSWFNPADTACTPCHDWSTWNHALSSTHGYTVSTAVLANDLGDPTGASARCMGCHEGNVAVDDFAGGPASPTEFMAGTAAFGTDLTKHHPVSFTFDSLLAVAHGGLNDPSVTPSGLTPGGTIAQDMLAAAGQLQCTSCHDPHDNTNGKFLVKPAAGGLCFTCHIEHLPQGTTGRHHIPRREDPWLSGQCTLCHGADLLGAGAAPACTSCHAPFSFPDPPVAIPHHGGDRYDPYNECSACHGKTLQGAPYGPITTPGCNACHGTYWTPVNLPPDVDTGGPYAGSAGASITLDASGTVDYEGDALSYQWHFGDGSPSQPPGPNPIVTHVYDRVGKYIGSLSVTDGINPPVVVPLVVEITEPTWPPGGESWNVVATSSPPEAFSITFDYYAGTLVGVKNDGVNAPSLAIGVELTGVIFWMDIRMGIPGSAFWGVGNTYFGNINRTAGTMSGIVFTNTGSIATFSGAKAP